jgi:hypothetical protein
MVKEQEKESAAVHNPSDNQTCRVVTVSIFPKRNERRLGAYPGERSMKSTPNAMPADQKRPMRESLRRPEAERRWMAKAAASANVAAPHNEESIYPARRFLLSYLVDCLSPGFFLMLLTVPLFTSNRLATAVTDSLLL